MNIILVSGSLERGRIITLSQAQVITAGVGVLMLMCIMGGLLYSFTLRYAVDVKNPYLQSLLSALYQKEALKNQAQLREHISGLATRLGEMQARLMRLDAVGERLAKVAGIKPQEINFAETPGRGGAAPSTASSRDISLAD